MCWCSLYPTSIQNVLKNNKWVSHGPVVWGFTWERVGYYYGYAQVGKPYGSSPSTHFSVTKKRKRKRKRKKNIVVIISRFQGVSFSWVSRAENGASHCFAKWFLNYNFVGSFGVGCCPPCLEASLVKESVMCNLVCRQ